MRLARIFKNHKRWKSCIKNAIELLFGGLKRSILEIYSNQLKLAHWPAHEKKLQEN